VWKWVQNILAILTLLLLPYCVLLPFKVSEPLRGRIGIALVFLFTGVGHFVKTEAMSQMLPPWVPRRVLLIYLTGVFELLAGLAVLVPQLARPDGILLCLFLIAILPSNVYAAFRRVDFGGHAAGPIYLVARIPLQFFLMGWIYWFTVELPGKYS
jgi:uncharacterized membrane protein